ncbi:MAG TPA: methyltransferase, partial [Candidatus Binataceae bacterium]|nr:methyltransferase [Candidatus Binataceae bacterium]
ARPEGQSAADFFTILVKCIFPAGFVPAREALARVPRAARARIKNILDIGAGAGAWSIPFAQANRAAKVTVVDMPQVTQVTREYTARFGVAEQYDYVEGDLREVEFGAQRYDLVLLGHIIHGEGRELGRRLIQRCAKALRDRGMLLIAEFIPNEDRTGPPLPMLFGLNMMLHTLDGDVFTMKEYRAWLKEAGFKNVKAIKTPAAPSPLLLATK